MTDYSYFSADYFENGEKCGTAYSNYKQGARQSPTYRGIAETLIEAFAPKTVLEIGCATGIIVKHMNDMGVDAHGIDVSEWAIENREHANVILTGAESLPYDDNQFDLVFSVHALEHIPEELAEDAFAEIRRVTKGVQLHMLPIVGTEPYTGPREQVIRDLKKDPTHNLLEDKAWWIEHLAKDGFKYRNFRLLWPSDTDNCELATCQLILSDDKVLKPEKLAECVDRQNIKTGIAHQKTIREFRELAAANGRDWLPNSGILGTIGRPILNRLIGRVADIEGAKCLSEGDTELAALDHFSALSPTLTIADSWRDLRLRNSKHIDFTDCQFSILVSTDGPQSDTKARLALADKKGNVAERWFSFSTGINYLEIDVGDFQALSTEVSLSEIETLYFGGDAQGDFRLLLSITNSAGKIITVGPWENN